MAGYNVKVTGKSGTVYNLSDKDFADNYDKYVEGSPGAKVTMYDMDGNEQSVGIENAKTMYGKGYTYWQGQKNPHATKAKVRAENQKARTQTSSPAATIAERARSVAPSKSQQSVAPSVPQPQVQPTASASEAQKQTRQTPLDAGVSIPERPYNAFAPISEQMEQKRQNNKDFLSQPIEEYKAKDKPLTDSAPRSIARTRRQAEQIATEEANRLGVEYNADKKRNNTVQSTFDNVLNRLEKEALEIVGNTGFYGEAYEQGMQQRAAAHRSPEKIQEAFEKQFQPAFDNYVRNAIFDADGNVSQRIKHGAAKSGISEAEYAERFVIPTIRDQVNASIHGRTLEKYLPKNIVDYYVKKVLTSTLGSLANPEGAKGQQMLNEAIMMTQEGENPHFSVSVKPSFKDEKGEYTWGAFKEGVGKLDMDDFGRLGMRLSGDAISFLADSPLFTFGGGAGSASLKIGGKIVGRFTPKASWLFNSAIENAGGNLNGAATLFAKGLTKMDRVKIATRTAVQSGISGSVNMGSFMSTSGAVSEMCANPDATMSSIGSAYLSGLGKGAWTGVGLGVASPLSVGMKVGAKSRLAKIGAEVGGIGLEIGSMTGLNIAHSRFIEGKEITPVSSLDELREMAFMVGAMKLQKAVGEPADFARKLAHLTSKSDPIALSTAEVNFLRNHENGKRLMDMVLEQKWDSKRTTLASRNANGNVTKLKEVGGLIADKTIPWEIRQKMALTFFNMAEVGGRPNYASFSVKGKEVTLEAYDGTPIAVRDYSDAEDLKRIISEEVDKSVYNGAKGMYGAMSLDCNTMHDENGAYPEYIKDASLRMVAEAYRQADGTFSINGKNYTLDEAMAALDENREQHEMYKKISDMEGFNPVNGLLYMFADETGSNIADIHKAIEKSDKPHTLLGNERVLLTRLNEYLKDFSARASEGKLAPEASAEQGNADSNRANLTSDEPNTEVVAEVNGAVAEATDAYAKANEEYYAAEVALRNFEELNGKESFTYQDVEELRNNGYVEAADAVENYLRATDNAIAAQNTFNNATIRKQAFEQGVDKRISEAVDIHFAGIAFSGRIKTDESPEGAEVNGDHVVTVTDNEGNVRYLRGGIVEPDGKITSESGMVIVVNENGEMDYKNAEELQVVENGILTKEQVAPGMKEWIKQAIANEYGVGVEQAPREAEPAPAEAKQPSAEAMQGDAEAKQSETEAKQPQEEEINSETVKNEETDNKPAKETLVNQKAEFPKDEKGKDDYLADGVTAESALARMREKGLANDEIEQMMQNRLKKSKKPTMGDDDDKFLEAKNRYNREQEIYNGILDLLKEESKAALEASMQSNTQETAPATIGQNVVDKFNNAERVVGRKGSITVNGRKIKGHYEFVNAFGITPSHDPFNDFKQNEGFPVDENGNSSNSRPYNTEQDRRFTLQMGRHYNGEAEKDIPIVTLGIPLSGNGRIMGRQIAAKAGTDKEYLSSLEDNVEGYGAKWEDVKKVPNTTLIFVPDEAFDLTPKTFDLFNKNERKTESSAQEAARRSRTLQSDEIASIISDIEQYGTMDTFYKSPKGIADLLKTLKNKGIIGENEEAELKDGDMLSAKGKEFVENLVLGALFKPEQIERLAIGKGLKRKVINGMKQIMESKKLGEFAVDEEIAEMINLVYEARKAGYTVAQYLTQTNMYGEGAKEKYSEFAQALSLALDGGVSDFKDFMTRFILVAKNYTTGVADMFGETKNKQQVVKEFTDIINKENGRGRKESESADRVENPTGNDGRKEEKPEGAERPADGEVKVSFKEAKEGDIYENDNGLTATVTKKLDGDSKAIQIRWEKSDNIGRKTHDIEILNPSNFEKWMRENNMRRFEEPIPDVEEPVKPKTDIKNLSTEELEKRAKFFEVAAKTEEELFENEEYVAIINELEGRTNDLYDRVKDATDEQIISALGGDEMLDAVKDAIEKLRKGEELGQIETGLLKAVALAKKEEAAKTAGKANEEKPKAGVTKLSENGTLVVGGVPKPGESNVPKREEAPSPAKDVRREELKAEFDAAAQEAKDALLDFFTKPHGSDKASAMLIPVTEGQIKGFTRTVRAVGKLGYTAIKLGAYDFKTWCDRVLEQMGDFFREKLGWDEKNISDFLSEMWEMKFRLGDEVHTIKEWAESEKAKLAGDSAEYADRESKKDRFKSVVEKTLRESLVDESKRIKSITELRKIAKECGLENVRDTDLQEMVELAIVDIARKFEANKEISPKDRFDQVKRLYELQPSLNQRDTDRIMMQQYSTPAPMALLMGRFVNPDGKATSGLEPSAGNGMLTIGLPKEIMHVNEIDEARLSNLQKQGFKAVTNQDGTLSFGGKKYKIMVTNPPFGSALPKEYDGYTISGLEHQMAINALESMEDDGRAAIIIGGRTKYAQNGAIKGGDKAFLSYLYQHYDVVDVINMDGKTLYARQGTGYPTRMILINGRRTGEDALNPHFPPVFSKARAELVSDYDELYKRIEDDILRNKDKSAGIRNGESGEGDRGNDRTDVAPADDKGVSGVRTTGRSEQPKSVATGGDLFSQPVGGGTTDGAKQVEGSGNAEGAGNDGVDKQPTPDNRGGQQPSEASRTATDESRQGGSGIPERPDNTQRPIGGNGEPVGNGQRRTDAAQPKRGLGTEKVPYRQQSSNPFSLHSLMPAEQADQVKAKLEELGDVDAFVTNELGYSSVEEMHAGLAAEQVDSVALAIHQMNNGSAFIIGDQTGIGKGRQAAALIRYGVKKGGCPVFITVKKGLFSDMYRDLCDIGSSELRPFIWAADDKEHSANVTDANGNTIFARPNEKEQKRVVDYINKHGKLPPEYDYVVTTYDSFKSGTKEYENGEKKDRKFGKKQNPNNSTYKNGQAKRDALEALAQNSYVIMDESHNAGGEGSNVSGYLQYITAKAKGTTFLSATFAKRPGNMPIYSLRTAISKAGVAIGDLIDAVKRGGATFQEIMSKALTEAGQMIRRERDMTGVTIDWRGIEDEEVIQKQREQYDTVIGLFNEIIDFQKRYIDPIVNELNDEAADVMGEVNHTPGTRDMGINNTPFASRTYNIVQQVLLSLKAEESAKRAIEHMKQGRKAVIAVANTNEGAAGLASNMGEDMEMPDLSVNLKKGLEGVLRITNKNASGDRTNTMIPLERLSDEARQRYAEIMEHIESASSGLSLSPIDVMKNELRKAGYKVGELTGRTAEFVYNEDGTVRRVKRTDTDKKKIAAQFNNGELDALILNRSAGTGISLHASSKFKDQRPRIMIVAQAQGDVNDEVQIRGRIDRTGQVARGMYEYVVSNIPSEQRLLMMLKSKLRSLDANTTSSQKSKFNEMQVQDVMNKYGDEVLIQYLAEHPDTYAKLADPLKLGEGFEILSPEDFVKGAQKADGDGATASKILGRMALLTVKEQEAMLDDITELYTAEINRLNDMGENDLEITEMPLRAKTLDKKVWEEGAEPNSGNPFADNTYVETVEMDILKKPMKASEVKASQERLLNGRTYEEYRNEQTEKLDKWQEEKKASLRAEYEERALRTAEKEREKYLKAALKNREKSGMTEQQCEDMADAQYKIKYDGVMEKLDTQLRNVDIQRRAFDRVLEQFDTEHVYVLPSDIYDLTQIDFGSHFGKVIGIKISNNFSTASSTVTFATLDGRRKITVPVSGMVKNKNGEKSDLFKWIDINTKHTQQGIKGPNAANTLKVLEMSNENWDKMTSSATRKKGYIITGNLLQALVSTKQQNIGGKLISYTTDTGEVRQGLLMSDTFDPKSVTGTKPISDAYFVIAEQRQRVTSADGDVTIDWRYGDMYSLRVPKSVKSGGKYFQDAELLDIVDDNSFYTRGGGMFADIRGEENLKRVLDILSKKLKVGVQTDNEGNINPNPDVLHRQSGYTEEQKRRWDEKENRVMFDRIKEFADKTNISDRVELHDSAEGLPEYAKSDKGWYDPQTGKIHIVINNHESREDVMHTLLHESVAHYGLRHLFGENFNTFLDEAYRAADNGIREAIDKIAKEKGLNTRTATEEYMAELTKEINFEKPEVHSWWERIKSEFVRMLHKLGDGFGIKITDDELRYVLWRSYENMKDPKKYKSLRGKADDIAKRIELGIATEQERMVARSMEQDQTILHRKLDAKNAEDKKRIDDFEKSEKIKSYRSMQVIDGKLYPPMNAAFSGALVEGLKPGDYDMAEEHPELAKPKKMRDGSTKYYFDLDKATKDATGKKATAVKGVLYDPYLHSKNNMLNDQFKSAWIRPNVVTVELEISKDDLNSGYRAEKAGLSVGEHEWKPGTVAKELIKEGRHDGKLYLTQMAKIVRVVPDAEVAENIAKMVEGTGIEIPENVVQPKLRAELEKLGVKIGAPEKGVNKTEQIEQALQAGIEVQNTIRLRGGDDSTAQKRALETAVPKHTPQYIETMRSAVQSSIDGLGGKGKVVTSEAELDATGRRALKKDSNMKGYYDIATGDVVVYLPNCESGYDAVKTVLHEKVGHEGLRQALGEEGYRQFYTKLWMSLSEAERKAISEKASRRKWDFFGEAMDETLAEKAEDFTDEGYSFIESVKDALTYVAAKLGINRSLTPRDVRIALWLSKNRLTGNENNLQYKLAKAAFEAKVRRYAPKEPTNFDGFKFTKDDAKAAERATNGEYIPSCLDGVYDSDGNIRTKVMSEEEREALDRSLTPAGRYARTRYENDLKRVSYLWTEGHQNNLAALDIAQNSIAGGREKVKDSENALWELNHLGGKDRTEQDAYEREHILPMTRQIMRMLPNLDGKDSHEKFVALEHYVTAKSGLERNRAFAVRDYRDKLLRKAGRTQAKANSLLKQADALQAEVDALMDADPQKAAEKKVEEEKIRKQAEKAQKEAENLREKSKTFLADYDAKRNNLVADLKAGRIDLRDFYAELDSFIGETIDKFDVSKADRSGLSDGNVFPEWAGEDKGTYDDDAVIEYVMGMESRLGKWAVEDLWNMIDKTAKFAVEKSYVSGEITKEAKDRANTMFTWYVPLRGFDADTAEDMWNYLDLDKSGVGRTLMGAKGRTSASDSPLNTLMLLGDSAILRGNRNVAKQALVRLVRNNPNNLISEYETWYKVGEDAEGNTVLTPSYPELTEEMTPKQIADAIREHEENIKEEMEDGVAVYRKLKDSPKNMPYRVLRPKQMAQHFINVNINGKPVTLVVHSHPRVAQAVNGLLVNNTRGLGAVKWLNSQISQLATSKSATFIARNAMRDYEFASLSIASTESAAYLGNFQKMYWQLWGKALGNAVPGTAIEVGNMAREAVNKVKNGEAAEPTENKSGVVNSMRILFKKQRAGELNTRKKPNGEYENEVEGYFDEFVKGGGVTGYVQLAGLDTMKEKTLDTLDSYFSNSTADKVKKMSAKTIGKVFKTYFDAIEAVNEAVENQTRFSAYYASRKAGRTRLRATQDAKNVSVNFNKTGSGSAVLSMKFGDSSTWYKANRRLAGSTAWFFKNSMIFYNAGVQGMSRTAQMWLNGGKGTKAKLAGMIGAVPFMLGASLPYLNGLMASAVDDDDDRKKYGENPYLQLPDYERRHNICLYMGKGRWFKIPVFIEGSTFFGLGDIAAGYSFYPELLGNKNVGVQVAEAVTQVSPVDAFGGSKVGANNVGGAMLGAVTPSLMQPTIAMWTNVGWTGSPISRSNEWNENDPNWTKGSEKTQSVYVDIAHMLNSATGGKDAADGTGVTKGAIDLDPAKMQYLVEQYFSSPGKEIVSYADILSSMVEEDKDVDWGRAPVLKAVYRDNTPYNVRNNDITRWYSYVEDSKKTEHDIREFRKHGSIVDARAIMDSKEGRQLRVIKAYAPVIKKLKTAKNMATRRADANLIQEKIAALTAEAMDRIDEIEKADKEK